MNSNQPTGQSNDNIRAVTDSDVASMNAAYAAAKATPCDFDGCDGTWHEPGVNPSEWAHHTDTAFDGGEVTVSLIRDGRSEPHAQVWMEGTYDDLSADDLRNLADTYASLPALLRAQADNLDALTERH
jgi:hypothetical protein